MERNEKCFCGSGIKYKKCHYGINENSLIGKRIKFYNELDKILLNNVEFKCKNGCYECCNDYFYISEEEFLVIMNYMINSFDEDEIDVIRKKAEEYMKYIELNYEDEFKELNNIQYGIRFGDIKEILRINTHIKIPCIFLKDGKCSIYKVRPAICRLFGSAKKFMGCDKIEIERDNINYKYLYYKLSNETIYTEFKRIIGKDYIEKPYPIADYIKNLYDIYREDWKYKYAGEKSSQEFIKRKIKNMY